MLDRTERRRAHAVLLDGGAVVIVGRSAARGLGALVNTARSVALPEDPVYFDREAVTAKQLLASATPLADILERQRTSGKPWRQSTLGHALRTFSAVVWEVRTAVIAVCAGSGALTVRPSLARGHGTHAGCRRCVPTHRPWREARLVRERALLPDTCPRSNGPDCGNLPHGAQGPNGSTALDNGRAAGSARGVSAGPRCVHSICMKQLGKSLAAGSSRVLAVSAASAWEGAGQTVSQPRRQREFPRVRAASTASA